MRRVKQGRKLGAAAIVRLHPEPCGQGSELMSADASDGALDAAALSVLGSAKAVCGFCHVMNLGADEGMQAGVFQGKRGGPDSGVHGVG